MRFLSVFNTWIFFLNTRPFIKQHIVTYNVYIYFLLPRLRVFSRKMPFWIRLPLILEQI